MITRLEITGGGSTSGVLDSQGLGRQDVPAVVVPECFLPNDICKPSMAAVKSLGFFASSSDLSTVLCEPNI